MFGIDINEYSIKELIGQGYNGLSRVYKADHKPSGSRIAIKKYIVEFSKDEFDWISEEIVTMRQFNHRNIMSLHTAFVDDYTIFVVSPLFVFGSAKDLMINHFNTGLGELWVALILKDILTGLDYLHKKGYIHRAIRASHILINESKAVLGGFRDATNCLVHGQRINLFYNLPVNSEKGLNWLAPEVLEQNMLGYTEKSDLYSIGITCCELANGVAPFFDLPTTLMLLEKIRGNQPSLLDETTCPSQDIIAQATESGMAETFAVIQTKAFRERSFSDPFHKFAEVCMSRYPADRPSAAQLLLHQFFKQTRHTSFIEQFHIHLEALQITGYRDENYENELNIEFGAVSLENFEWDF